MTVTIFPTMCKGCIHLKHRMDGEVKIFDRCTIWNRTITDEVLAVPCEFYKRVKE